MELNRVLCIIGLCTVSSGCDVSRELTRRTVEQFEYHETTDELFICVRNHLLANSGWDEYREANPAVDFSKHFVRGFKQGYADYLDGGSAEPPVIPPRRYWKMAYQTPQGHEQIEDWFGGYRMGTSAAEQSGYRQWVTIPTCASKSNTKDRYLPAAADEANSNPIAATVASDSEEAKHPPKEGNEVSAPKESGAVSSGQLTVHAIQDEAPPSSRILSEPGRWVKAR